MDKSTAQGATALEGAVPRVVQPEAGSALLPSAALPDLISQDIATSFMGPTLTSLQPLLIQNTKEPEEAKQQPQKGEEGTVSVA